MQVSKEALERVRTTLTKELTTAQSKLRNNRTNLRGLSKEQRTLKSEIGVIFKMLRELDGKSAKTKKKHGKVV